MEKTVSFVGAYVYYRRITEDLVKAVVVVNIIIKSMSIMKLKQH